MNDDDSCHCLFVNGKFTECCDFLQRTLDERRPNEMNTYEEIEFIKLRNNLLVCNSLVSIPECILIVFLASVISLESIIGQLNNILQSIHYGFVVGNHINTKLVENEKRYLLNIFFFLKKANLFVTKKHLYRIVKRG